MMLRIFLICFFGDWGLGVARAQESKTPSAPEELSLVVGIEKQIQLDFIPHEKVSIGRDNIIKHKIITDRKQIILTPIAPGNVSLTVWDQSGTTEKKYTVNVIETNQSKIVQELKEFLGDIEGIEIGIKANKTYVGGNLVVPEDIGRILTILDLEPYSEVIRLMELSPQSQRLIAKKMEEEIQKHGLKDVRVRVVNKKYWLEGSVASAGQRDRALEIAEAYLPINIESLASGKERVQELTKKTLFENFISVNEQKKPQKISKLIKVTAQFVELSKDYARQFQFKWTPFISKDAGGSISIGRNSGGVTTRNSGTLSATIDNLLPRLEAAKNAGYARVLQSGVVITKEGVPATISKNLNRYFAVGSGEFTQTKKSTTGFTVKLGTSTNDAPKIVGQEKIDLNIGVSVSSSSDIGTPTEASNTVNTNVVIQSKSTAVIGGIVTKKSKIAFNKPQREQSESSIPLVNFIRSKEQSNEKARFAVFVTPEIIESASQGTEEIKRTFRKRGR